MRCTHSSFQLQVTKVVKTITRHTFHPVMVIDNLSVKSRPVTRTPTPVSTPPEAEPVKNHRVWCVPLSPLPAFTIL